MAATLDMVKLMGLPVAALEGMKTVFDGDNLKLIEAALAVHTAKPGKAKAKLGWEATTSFEDMISEMVRSDVELIRREQGLRRPSEEPTHVAAQ